jgi:lipid-A-disaccharide synthase-like uncharacterized protein
MNQVGTAIQNLVEKLWFSLTQMTPTQIAWFCVGLFAQLIFSMRFMVQWIASERRGESVIPVAFWYMSLVGTTLLFAYAVYRRDPIFILGQAFGSVVYTRNLMLIYKRRTSPVSAGNNPS